VNTRPRPLWSLWCTVWLLFALAVGAGAPASATQPAPSTHPREIVLLTWSDYIDPKLVAEFEQRFDAKVKFVFFETDERRDDLLIATGGKGYDLVLTSGVRLAMYARRNWLSPLTDADVPNRRHIDPRWADAYPGSAEYGVPYAWGTLGIAYRADLVPGRIESWMDLFRPAEALRGHIMMIGDSLDLAGVALKALGYSANSQKVQELEAAGQLLLAQKPFVKTYSYTSLDKEAALVTGDIRAGMAYNGDAMTLHDLHPAIRYVVPKEGGILWVDYLAVMRDSRERNLATAFIDFLEEPENAARLAEHIRFATPNRDAEKLLPTAFRGTPEIYPTGDILRRCESYTARSPRVQKLVNDIFARVVR
jgi:spermidine/putrescine transport system substrate-binding protein